MMIWDKLRAELIVSVIGFGLVLFSVFAWGMYHISPARWLSYIGLMLIIIALGYGWEQWIRGSSL